jgi:sugar diacid utilization regulator
MSDSKVGLTKPVGLDSGQLSQMSGLLELSSMMFDGRAEDDIVRLAMTSVASSTGQRVEASYLVSDEGATDDPLHSHLIALGGGDGPVRLLDGRWHWAFALHDVGDETGYLLVDADRTPDDNEMALIRALARQSSAALSAVGHKQREREHAIELRRLTEEKAAVNARLSAEVERRQAIHEVLTNVSTSKDGQAGVARALHGLTGLPVAVEDRFGNLRAWAGPDKPDPYPKGDPHRRSELLRQAAISGGAIRDKKRLFIMVQPRSDVIGVLALIDPDQTAGQREVFALEHAATVLAIELSHMHNLAEMELRLRRDLVDDVISGTDDESAYSRASAIGHDLHGAHQVMVAQWRAGGNEDTLLRAVTRAAAQLDLSALVARRPDTVVALIRGRPPSDALHRAIAKQMGNWTGAVGIGGQCEKPSEFPRSFAEASRALDIRLTSRTPNGVTTFEELGVLRILHNEDNTEIRTFVQEWLGTLLDYDMRRHADLVQTLSQYLDCGGNYDDTAATLLIHRSTLRYRLQRIRDITGLDLADVDTRLNLHVATRAWKVLDGSNWRCPPPRRGV